VSPLATIELSERGTLPVNYSAVILPEIIQTGKSKEGSSVADADAAAEKTELKSGAQLR
jgi:hypothetical protein